ncbi:MAG: serine hydrolase domain-containing protein [Gemmatimonadales bacterium]|nr:serine hydrolase domain-containing protein [Gemmatimonadales bacterium]
MRVPFRGPVGFALLLSAAGDGTAQTRRLDRSEVARIVDSLAVAAKASGEVPGFSVGVAIGSTVRITSGYGQADLENAVPATAETIYRIASVTKQFTGAAVVQLVEQGKLKLDDRLTTYFPNWPAPAEQVTVRMLLNHTSGVRDYVAVPRWRQLRTVPLPHDSLLGLVINEPFDFPPGTAFRYSNTGYYILGVIIEKVSGLRYGDYIEQRLAQPLGLTSIRYCDDRPVIAKRARGYSRTKEGFANAQYIDMNQPFSAGSLCASVGDLLDWSRALARGKVVSAEGYRTMTTPVALPEDQPMNYGFGLSTGVLAEHRFIYHNGSVDGFRSQLITFPDDSLTIAIIANADAGLPEALERRISRRLLAIPETVIKDLPIPPALRARVVGRYRLGEDFVQVAADGAGLSITLPGAPAARLLYQGDEKFVLDNRREVGVSFRGTGPVASDLVLATPGAAVMLTRAP